MISLSLSEELLSCNVMKMMCLKFVVMTSSCSCPISYFRGGVMLLRIKSLPDIEIEKSMLFL